MNDTPSNSTKQGIVQDHPASISTYVKQGWKLVPIPKGTKGPRNPGWNLEQNAITDPAQLPPEHGFGLAHAYSGTMALDIDAWDRAAEEFTKHGIDLNALYLAPDAVIIDSGKAGHGKLLYRMPTGMVLPSKKLIDTDPTGLKYNYIDFRCATSNGSTVQDVLPPSIHPETCQPYRWAGYGHHTRLPIIPDSLLSIWQKLIEADQARSIPDSKGVDASWDDVRAALEFVTPDVEYSDWVQIGMALHWAGTQTGQEETAFYIWDEWSALGTKYKNQAELFNHWRSFKPGNGVTLGTLFHQAKHGGWVRPMPSAQELFADVGAKPPTDSSAPTESKGFDPILGLRPPAPEIDMSILPPVLATRAQEVADGMGADPLVPLFAGMGAVAGVADARIRLELVPGFKVPPVIWLMTIGNPADMKSPASRPMRETLKAIEADDREPYKKRLLMWKGKESAYNAALKNYLDYHASPEAQLENDSAGEVDGLDLEPPPVPLKITVQDITSQKLVRHAAERPRGLVCWLDEMAHWMESMTDSRSGENRSTWVESYESEAYEMDRVGSGSIWCQNFAVSIYGNVQPDIIRHHLEKLSKDGLIQRFLPAILRTDYSFNRGNPVPDCFTNKATWDQVLRMIYSIPEQTYTLSQEAKIIFQQFQDWHIELKREEHLLNSDKGFQNAIGKLPGNLGRLALIWHLIEQPFNPQLEADLLSRAITFIKDYVVPALRYMFDEVGDSRSIDSWVCAYILQHSGLQETITLRSLKNAARRKLVHVNRWDKDRVILDAMQMLENADPPWVALIESDQRQNSYTWAINPQLQHTYAEQRDAVLRIKQKRMDENYMKTKGRVNSKTGTNRGRHFIPGYDPERLDNPQ